MSEFHVIKETLAVTARRRRWQRGWRGFWKGFLIAGGVWLLGLILYKALPMPEPVLFGIFFAGWIAPIAGFLKEFSKAVTLNEAARWLDQEKQLKERLSTALEVADSKKDGEWQRLLMTDAATHAGSLDVAKMMPFSLPKAAKWSFILLVITAGVGFVPEYRTVEYRQKKQNEAVMKEVGERVTTLTKKQMTNRPPALESVKKALEETAELGQQLQKAKLTRDEALKNIAKVTDKVKEETRDLMKNQGLQRMQQAARTSGQDQAATPEQLQKQIDDLKDKLGQEPPSTKELSELQAQLEKMQAAAAEMKNQSGNEAEASKQAMSQALSSLMKQAEAAGLDSKKLEEAMNALKAGKTDQVLKELNAAFQDMEKMKELAKALENLQMQKEEMGKDLAEQLERGQVAQAQSSLQQMIQKLQSGQASAEDMKKMLQELRKAQEPAEGYGKASEHLGEAVAQAQAGNKSDAVKELTEAIKELQKMQEQMGDLESLMAALENLQQAQQCVGNGKCDGMGWGMRNRPGFGGNCKGNEMSAWFYHEFYKSGGKGGLKAGTAVDGTWSEADVKEPTDPLLTTKVKGQITPGGPMPSITLKGVSIRGQSTVAFEEVAATAQSEAESALAQDKVPRAYRNAVRDYFDDFKKKQ
ncbi:MAG TPA: hypothetical protein VGH19_07665 [Verrucomicrobiae bacterium]